MRLRPEELVTYACRGSRRAGDGHTSCARPFPGCPGLSQSRPRRVFHAAVLSTVLSRNTANVRRAAAEVHGFLPPICSPRAPVNILRVATCSRVIHQAGDGGSGERSSDETLPPMATGSAADTLRPGGQSLRSRPGRLIPVCASGWVDAPAAARCRSVRRMQPGPISHDLRGVAKSAGASARWC